MKKSLQIILTITFFIFTAPHTAAAGDQKSILVTGASTGIGRHLAETLAADGYHVYAGARKDKDLAALDAIDIELDQPVGRRQLLDPRHLVDIADQGPETSA